MLQGLLAADRRPLIRRKHPGERAGIEFLLILAVTWIANYLHFSSFGFYEDDWYYFALPYQYTFLAWFGLLRQEWIHFHLGRPLQDASLRVFGYLGTVLSSISALYLFAFILVSFSALLLYRVLRERFSSSFSTLATLIFVLSPLWTIKQFLNFAFTIGPGLSFLCLAILLFNRRRRILSLVLAIAALLTYESLFFLYLAAPLCRRGGLSKRRRIDLWIHAAICVSTLAIYALLRRFFAEARVTSISTGPLSTLLLTLSYCATFTIRSFRCYIYAAYVGLREANWESAFYCLLVFIPALTLVFGRWPVKTGSLAAARRKRWLWTAAAGLLLTALGYTLAYFHLEHEAIFPLSGRATRVSAAASIGSSLLIAALLSLIAESRSGFWRTLSRVLTVAFLSLLFLYSCVIQRDYVNQWSHQRGFLTQAMLLSPDIRNDTQFIVRTGWLEEPLFPHTIRRPSIGYSRHGLQVSMRTMLGWDLAPKIFFVYSDVWPRYLSLHSDQKLYWTQESFPGGWARSTTEPVTPGRVIVMNEDSRGTLARSETPIWVGGRQIIQLPQPATGAKPESNWPFLPRSPLLQQVVPDFVLSAAMSHLAGTPTQPVVRIAGALSADSIVPAGAGSSLEKGPPLRIITAANSGYFAASFPILSPPGLFGARYAYLRARVVKGRIGIGVGDAATRMYIQRTLDPSPAPVDIYIPIVQPDRARNLILYNADLHGMPSELLVEDVALVVSAERALEPPNHPGR